MYMYAQTSEPDHLKQCHSIHMNGTPKRCRGMAPQILVSAIVITSINRLGTSRECTLKFYFTNLITFHYSENQNLQSIIIALYLPAPHSCCHQPLLFSHKKQRFPFLTKFGNVFSVF